MKHAIATLTGLTICVLLSVGLATPAQAAGRVAMVFTPAGKATPISAAEAERIQAEALAKIRNKTQHMRARDTKGGGASEASKDVKALYQRLGLAGRMDFAVFARGVDVYQRHGGSATPYLTIIDYSQPSSARRFFVIDMASQQLVFNTLVAHGENSGQLYATRFSNRVDSHQTSLGVFITSETYMGENGYSLRIDGVSPGLNDNARRRDIVIHPAAYASEEYLQRNGRLGRSWGCPALPTGQARAVIDTIKGGSVIMAWGTV